MGAKFVCDGCGKEEPGEFYSYSWHKPRVWYERSDGDGPQTACSRECIDRIASKTGKTGVVLPL